MTPLTTLEKYLIGLGIIFVLMLGSGIYGWYKEHLVLVAYQAQIAQIGKDQEDKAKAQTKLQEDNANEASKNIISATSSINDWYLTHPVVKRVCDSSGSQMPGPNSNTSKSEQTSQSNLPATSGYVSDYNPKEVELMADQLDQLLQLLHKDGAQFTK